MRDLLAELRSWATWILHYRLPCWLSTPFRYSVFKSLYFLLLGVLFLVYLPTGILREFIGKVLIDVWGKVVGENSQGALDPLLKSFPSDWILPTMLVLIVWGVVVWIWAWKQQLFFETLDNLNIKVLRGPGKRLPFLKRLQKGVGKLGLGPSARLLDIYLPCDEDQILRRRIIDLSKNRSNLGLIIAGPAISGKTRVAMELIASTRTSLVFIWSGTSELRSWLNIPTWGGSALLFADNLVLAKKQGDIGLHSNLLEFLQQCANTILVGTIRKNLLPEDHKMLEVVELSKIEQGDLWEFANEITKVETKIRKIKVDANVIMNRYNGYPASLVVGLDAMREIYHGLELEPRATLQSLRLLWEMGIRQLTTERVWEVSELLNGTKLVPVHRTQILEILGIWGFISLHKNDQAGIEIYESYLDQVIDLPGEYAKLETEVMSLWAKRGDAYAFIERGYTLTQTYSIYYQNNPQRALLLGIGAYKEALRFYTPGFTPLDFALIQNNLGNAYVALAEHQDSVENLKRGLIALEEALCIRTPELDPLDYARTQNNLGNAYRALAVYQDPVENLKRAVAASEEALRFVNPELAPLDYAMTQNFLGVAYTALAEYQDSVANLRRAVKDFEEALRFYTPELTPLDYAMIQNNLGNANCTLARHQDPVENLQRGVKNYEEALRFRTPELAPLNFALTQNNLGAAYVALARHQDPVENLQRAVIASKEALRFYTPELAPLNFARTQNHLGVTYRALAEYQDPVENLRRAVTAFEEALRFYTPEFDQPIYSTTQNNLGIAFGTLAGHQDPVENLQCAVTAFEEALRFYTPELAPLNFAGMQDNLGMAYSDLAAHQDPVKNLQRAETAFEEALRFYNPILTPHDYVTTQDNLGLAFLGQAREISGNEREKYLVRARDAFSHVEQQSTGRATYNLACINALLGDETECLRWLRKCIELAVLPEHDHLKQDSDLDPVRDKDWFKQFEIDAYGDD